MIGFATTVILVVDVAPFTLDQRIDELALLG
jgi:hypothetical protein